MFTKDQYRVLFLVAGTTILLSLITSGLAANFVSQGIVGPSGSQGPSGGTGPTGNPGEDGQDGEDGTTINLTDVILEEEYDEAIVIENSQQYAANLVSDGYLGIDTIEDFRKIGRDVDFPANEDYVLLNDLDFEGFIWTDEISDSFVGIFDGAGFTLSNLTYSSETTGFGLFQIIGKNEGPGESALLRNFTITDFDIDAFDRVGLLASYSEFLVEVESVEIRDSFIKSKQSSVGAFFGSSKFVSFKHSLVEDSIITTDIGSETGGFVGYSESALIENSHSIGNSIYGNRQVGGLLGLNLGFSIYESSNQSLVIGRNDRIGGLVGLGSTYRGSILKNSYNTGTIISTENEGNYVGGLIGEFTSGNYGYGIMERVSNSGNVYSNGDYLGGLVGDLDTTQFLLNEAFNTGHVITSNPSGQFVGGIFGYLDNQQGIRMLNVYNLGNITGDESVGGIFGQSNHGDEYGYFQNFYNGGRVTATGKVGGISGFVNSGESNVMVNVFNVGELVNSTPENNILPGHIIGGFNDDLIVHNGYYFWDGVSPYRFAVTTSQYQANVFLARVVTDLSKFNTIETFIFRNIWDFVNVWTFPTTGDNTFPVFIQQPETTTAQIDPATIDYSIFRVTVPA